MLNLIEKQKPIVVRINHTFPKFKERWGSLFCDDIIGVIWDYYYDLAEHLKIMNRFLNDVNYKLEYNVDEYLRMKVIVSKRVIRLNPKRRSVG